MSEEKNKGKNVFSKCKALLYWFLLVIQRYAGSWSQTHSWLEANLRAGKKKVLIFFFKVL